MRKSILAATLAAAVFVSTAAQAEPFPPPTAEEIATATAMAERIISEASAADVFENATLRGAAVTRHKASGMYCLFDDKYVGKIAVAPDGPRGDRVVCEAPHGYWIDQDTAIRATPGATSQDELAKAVAEIRARLPQFQQSKEPKLPPLSGLSKRKRSPDPETWLVTEDGQMVIYLVVRVQDGWVYRARQTMTYQVYLGIAALNGQARIDDIVYHPSIPPSER